MAISKNKRERIFWDSGNICHYCGVRMTIDTFAPTSRCINHLIPKNAMCEGDDSPLNLVAACYSCVQVKNGLGADVMKFVGDVDALRRVINDRRRIKGLPWNEQYASTMEQIVQANLKQGERIKTVDIVQAQEPIDLVNQMSTPAMEKIDSIDKDLHTAAIQRAENKRLAEKTEIGKMSDEELQKMLDSQHEEVKRPKVVGGVGALMDAPEED
jgi:hypothetical protein